MESDPLALDNSSITSSIFIKEEPGTIDEFEPKNKKIKLNNPDIWTSEDPIKIKTEVNDDNFGSTNSEFAFVDPNNVEIKNEEDNEKNFSNDIIAETNIRIIPSESEEIVKISPGGFQCTLCEFVTKRRKSVKNYTVINHMIEQHMKNEGDVYKYVYVCSFCSITTSTIDGIHCHLHEFHKFNFMKKAELYTWVPIIYFFDGRSLSRHKLEFPNLSGALIEHFLEGLALLRHWHINPNEKSDKSKSSLLS